MQICNKFGILNLGLDSGSRTSGSLIGGILLHIIIGPNVVVVAYPGAKENTLQVVGTLGCLPALLTNNGSATIM